jgi:hypothetical protein
MSRKGGSSTISGRPQNIEPVEIKFKRGTEIPNSSRCDGNTTQFQDFISIIKKTFLKNNEIFF